MRERGKERGGKFHAQPYAIDWRDSSLISPRTSSKTRKVFEFFESPREKKKKKEEEKEMDETKGKKRGEEGEGDKQKREKSFHVSHVLHVTYTLTRTYTRIIHVHICIRATA